jgi:hypothetical protein
VGRRIWYLICPRVKLGSCEPLQQPRMTNL